MMVAAATAAPMVVTPVHSREQPSFSSADNDNDSHDSPNCYDDDEGEESHELFRKLQAGMNLEESDWEQIGHEKQSLPFLTKSSVLENQNQMSGSLVRVRGMVQDMLDAEYFGTTGGGGGSDDNYSSSTYQNLGERTPLFVTPIPFTSPWFQKELDNAGGGHDDNDTDEHRDKRVCRPKKHDDHSSLTDPLSSSDSWWPAGRMQQSSAAQHNGAPPVLAKLYYDQYHHSSNKKLLMNETVELVGVLEWEAPTIAPANQNNSSCGQQFMSSTATTTQELSSSLQQQQQQLQQFDEGLMLTNAMSSVCPKSIPRLHVLWYETFSMDQILPSQQQQQFSAQVLKSPSLPPAITLARALHVTETTGKLIWMTLLSMAERSCTNDDGESLWTPVSTTSAIPNGGGGGITLGCLSAQLVLPDADTCNRMEDELTRVLNEICPTVVNVGKMLTTSGQNMQDDNVDTGLEEEESPSANHVLVPGKRHGRIGATPLQLPRGATLVVNLSDFDAVAASAGRPQQQKKLTSHQVDTLQCLQSMAKSHSVPYQFDGNLQLPFEADVRMIVLSTPATRKLVPCHAELKCSCGSSSSDIATDNSSSTSSTVGDTNNRNTMSPSLLQHNLLATAATHQQQQQLESLRLSLANARCGNNNKGAGNNNIGLPGDVLERAQQDFIQRRARARGGDDPQQEQRNGATVAPYSEDDLHRWLTLTRLHARHRGQTKANLSDWEAALALDEAVHAK